MAITFVSRMLAVVGFFAAAGVAAAQGSIAGKVTNADGGAPVGAARIQVLSGSATVAAGQSGDDGSYRIANVAAGSYAVLFTRIGYAARRIENVSVSSGGTATVNAMMSENAAVLNSVTVTGNRGAAPEKILTAPASISVITTERIAERPSVSVADHLKGTLGLSVSTGGIAQANIVSRGFNNAFSTAMLMLQDYRYAGVPSLRVNIPFLFTGTNEDIERIEVLNGPASALYGPNSANGVLHVITKSPFSFQGTTITLDGGNRDLVRVSGRHSAKISDKAAFKVSGEYTQASDFEYNDPNEPATYPSVAPAGRRGTVHSRNFDLQKYSGEARLDLRPGENTEFISTVGMSKIGSALEVTTAFGAAQVKNWSYLNLQQRFRHKKFFAQVFYNSSNSGNKNGTDLEGTYYLRTGLPVVDRSNILVGQIQQAFDFAGHSFIAGADYIKTTPQTEGTINGRNEDDDLINEMGAYMQGTFKLTEKLDLVSAVRADNTDRLEGTQFSPRAAFVYKYSPTQNFRFTFNRAFNSPASFSYFLDQVSNPNQAPGFALRTVGNPAKEGWKFNRGCDASINTGLCQRSPFIPGNTPVASTSVNAYPGFIQALPGIIQSLPTLTAAQKAQLGGVMTQFGPILNGLRPTNAQVGTVLRIGSAAVTAADTKDLAPLSASFNNTWELGYKGILGSKARIAVDAWYQIRGDVGVPIGQLNPLVFYEPNSLGLYLATNITQALAAGGMPLAQAQATASSVAGALVPVMAALPQGSIALNNAKLATDQSIIATYRNGTGQIDVRGLDIGIDYLASDVWTLEGTYSHIGQNVFSTIGGTINPLMSNSPKHRATATARFKDEEWGFGMEYRFRYADAFPINSGLLNSLGSPPNPAGTVLYEPIPVSMQVDIGFNKTFPLLDRTLNWSFNIQNVGNNRVPTFVGVAAPGRLLLTRLSYSF